MLFIVWLWSNMLFLLLFALVAISAAQGEANIFLNPPTNGINNDFTQNPTYILGSTITLLWTTDYPSTDLVIWQNGNPASQTLECREAFQPSSKPAADK
jgi:hypothetical protein